MPFAGGGGGAATLMLNVAFTLSLVAVITADPAATPVTKPVLETVAAAVLFELQVIVRPVSTLLLASRVVAVSCVVCPTIMELAPLTVTDATGVGAAAVIVTVAVSASVPSVAVATT
jgi:hypothetical protein